MPSTYHETPRKRGRSGFTPDKWSHRERMRRTRWRRNLVQWWLVSSTMERIVRIWWWGFCVAMGAVVGWIVSVAALIILAASGAVA